MAACPCDRADGRGLPLAWAACCARYLAHDTPAPDAESLMRSRYAAFVLARSDYLLATWHTSQRPASIEFDPGVKWLGLEVRQHRVLDATHSEVEFVARQKSPGSAALRLREGGRWYYVDGDQL
ncbi:MAG: YchJ family metal-binding protein [Polaromonas sp.]|uniref:YchJ family protein n=1 Tax=Polaromonas sp. TaxID=1869339 RepID=UPI00273576D9|nr:YchJ family metal-binding protein [Polaromonas sp.]MDP2818999.1 YchJ family metal-binding protein [Polaromonas sp.]